MRVALIVEQSLAPVPGGTGRYSVELAAALAERAPQDSTVTGWVAWHRDQAAATVPGVAGPRMLSLARRPLIAAWERRVGPAPRAADLVHAPTPLAPPRRGRPLVVTVHDAVPWSHPDTLTPRGVSWHRKMIGYAVREADRIVVPTRAVADELSAELSLGDKVAVVGEGASLALRLPVDAEERARRLELPADGYLLSLATLEPRKGLDVLIAALAEDEAPDLPLLLVGQPGWGGVDPAGEAARRGVDPGRIRQLGRLSDADLAVVLHRAMMLVSPSRAEGFGLPVLEAMTAGVPAVTSDAAALVEVGGGATVVTPVGDAAALAVALGGLATDSVRRRELTAAGLRRAQDYSWSGAADSLWRLYEELT